MRQGLFQIGCGYSLKRKRLLLLWLLLLLLWFGLGRQRLSAVPAVRLQGV
jgi:hypothetical protein